MIHYRLILAAALFVANIALTLGQKSAEDRCLDPNYHEKCASSTRAIFDDFVYLKSRPFSKEMEGMLFELTLKQKTLYLFNTCEGSDANAIINLYSFDNDSVPIASTWNNQKNRNTRLLNFYPSSTGKYLISVSFEKSEEYCVVVVCGMIRKNLEQYIRLPGK